MKIQIIFKSFEMCCLLLDGKVDLPEELKELYALYQQEIHASTYENTTPSTSSDVYTKQDFKQRLPPIYSARLCVFLSFL